MTNKSVLSLVLLLIVMRSVAQHLPDSFFSRGMGGGGALFFPTINPADDDEYYVSCDMSELFHTHDFGRSYTQLHHKQLQVFGTSTYEFTYDNTIAYSNFNDGNNGYPVKTTDGGKTWKVLSGHNSNDGQVSRMIANYANPQQLIVGYYGVIYISNNGGTTFNVIKTAANNGVGIILAGAMFDGANIVVATNEGLFRSVNSGVAFSPMAATGMAAGEVIWNFKGAKNGTTTRYVCIASTGASTYNGIMPWDYNNHAKQVYVMDNNSGTWTAKSAGITFSNDFIMYVGMASNDVNTIYLGGHDNALGAPLVYKSADGGTTWNKVFKSSNNQNVRTGWSGAGGDKNWSWGETCFGITVAPNNADKVIFPDFSFVHVSSDGGNSWRQAYTDSLDEHPAGVATPVKKAYHSIGIENTTAWQVHWTDSNNLFAAFSDIGGIRSRDGGKSWGYQFSGLSVNSVYRFAQAGGNFFAATSNIHDMYQSTRLKDAQLDAADAQGKIWYSTDKGDNWSLMHNFGHPVFWLAADPNNTDILYASVIHYGGGGANMKGGIYRTNNAGALAASTFVQLPAPPRTEGHPACVQVLNDGKVVCTFSGRYTTTFTASSGVFIYDPATNTWADKSDPGMQYWTKDLVIDPSDPAQNTWYVAVFSGWGTNASGKGGLYKTTDRGDSWTKLTLSQFDRVTSVTFNPSDLKQVFLTTETQGLWVCNDITVKTPAFLPVNQYNFRQPERVFFNPYKASEMWVSSFGNSLKVSSIQIDQGSNIREAKSLENGILIYPIPVKGEQTVLMVNEHPIYSLGLYTLQGQLIHVNSSGLGSDRVQIQTAELAKGIYILSVNGIVRRIVLE